MQLKNNPKIIIIIGVSGSGKSTISKLLSTELNMRFIEGDDFHPKSNIEKMSNGIPLSDQDRWPWLDLLNREAKKHQQVGCVISCSALKQSYRNRLQSKIEDKVIWIHLYGKYDLIFKIMQNRKAHFMDEKMLRSQFETLEPPKNTIEIDIANTPQQIVETIKKKIS